MAATAWLMSSFSSCIVWGFDSYTVFFKCPQRKLLPPHPACRGIFSGDTWKVRYTNQIPTRYRNWRTTSATQLQPSKSLLHGVYLNMIRCVQLCIDAGGNHLQHLLWWYTLSAFGYCIDFCIYAMLRTWANFSWPTLYNQQKRWNRLKENAFKLFPEVCYSGIELLHR